MNKKLRDWLESIFYTAIIVSLLFAFFWPFQISGASMQNSFFQNDRIAISRVLAFTRQIEHGDFVVCKMYNNDEVENCMKRVVAVSGDKIEIRGGEVFVNGEKLAEEYLSEPYTDGEVSLEVGVDEFFVMGDNRSVSFDSRRVGTLKGSDIIGKVLLKWYPFDEFQFYKQHGEKK